MGPVRRCCWPHAGGAKDPEYTVIPQKERKAAREAGLAKDAAPAVTR
jgi:hypothetical protein